MWSVLEHYVHGSTNFLALAMENKCGIKDCNKLGFACPTQVEGKPLSAAAVQHSLPTKSTIPCATQWLSPTTFVARCSVLLSQPRRSRVRADRKRNWVLNQRL
ncbi:hypothetical protein GOP47_0025611 [Adiantum capillus-veneris]|uniref:Uncharacterized protein n=1 Tax=Adiantum capillus-veneris TaxID=13818 RepID=A0A9D4U188_ADICA|nr:hypothetical protein GOP47_0025611 [Adiantum capillus-veneris]